MPTTMPVSSFRELVYLLRSVLQISAACDVVALEHRAGLAPGHFQTALETWLTFEARRAAWTRSSRRRRPTTAPHGPTPRGHYF